MKVIGLTGSIGMGKSTVAVMFAEAGIPVFDADAEVHRLQGPGGYLVGVIESAFPGTTNPESGVDRQRLGAAVFGKPEALKRLESIVHPAVAESRANFLSEHKNKPLVLLDVPLLFEAGGWASVDSIVVVSAPAEVQRERVLARPGMTEERFESILAKQLPDSEKRARADFIIDSNLSLSETRAQVDHVIACLMEPLGG